MLSRSRLLALSLLLLVTGCQGTGIGQSIQTATAADPRLLSTPGATPSALDTPLATTPIPQNSDSPTPLPNLPGPQASTRVPEPGEPDFIGPVLPPNLQAANPPSPSSTPAPAPVNADPTQFSDLSSAPEELRSSIQDLAALAVLTPRSPAQPNLFDPNRTITRREYARWLVAANNRFFTTRPGRQIRLARSSEPPVFTDLRSTDPDFGAIQGLADAGLIASSLSGDNSAVQFRPDAPLTREDLLLWKVPLDTRQALPGPNADAVSKTWGFQDVNRIAPKALRAILADNQAGDLANIRRAFGYTTLFQPKRPVSRAEAATVLWYFGSEGDGLSARDALQSQEQSQQPSAQTPPAGQVTAP